MKIQTTKNPAGKRKSTTSSQSMPARKLRPLHRRPRGQPPEYPPKTCFKETTHPLASNLEPPEKMFMAKGIAFMAKIAFTVGPRVVTCMAKYLGGLANMKYLHTLNLSMNQLLNLQPPGNKNTWLPQNLPQTCICNLSTALEPTASQVIPGPWVDNRKHYQCMERHLAELLGETMR